MSALSVAKKDFKDTRRTRTLWVVLGVMTILGGLLAYVAGRPLRNPDATTFKSLYRGIMLLTAVIVPLVAMVATYLAIAGEIDSGSIKFMLSLPNSRWDVFVGKFLSRGLTVGGAILLTFLVATVLLGSRTGTVPVGFVLGSVAIMTAYSLSFVSVALAMSSAMASRSQAVAGAIGAYFVMVVLYVLPMASVSDVVRWLHHDLLGFPKNPNLYDFATYTSPYFAQLKATNLVLPSAMENVPFRRGRVPEGTEFQNVPEVARTVDLPVYLTDEFSLVILAFWIVVPLAIGYWRFERTDLK